MRIRFEFEWRVNNPISRIKQAYKEYQCSRKGHDWKPYKKPNDLYSLWFDMSYLYDNRKIVAICARCGENKYKKLPARTISFSRYTPLGQVKPEKRKAKRATK